MRNTATGRNDPGKFRKRLILAIGCSCLAVASLGSSAASSRTTAASPAQRADFSPRVRALVARMTLDEKISLIHGASEPRATNQGQAGWLPGIARLGVPPMRLADGPHGVLTREVSGAPPSTLALAATFSAADAQDVGTTVGRNARARGIDVVLQPFVNLFRDPTFSRAHNTYGEDPLLTGTIGSGLITGIQSQGVMAQAKHFVAYDGGNDVTVGQQALHELYLAPFDAAVRAGVSSIMCAYNKVNGAYACGNGALQNDVLRGELGFKGFVTSDWGASHGAEFLVRGLDLEMPGEIGPPMGNFIPSFFINDDQPPRQPPSPELMGMLLAGGTLPEETGTPSPLPGAFEQLAPGNSWTLKEALSKGTVTVAMIDEAALRILGQMERFGLLDGRHKHSITPESVAANASVFERVAGNGAVLLKNDGLLPLKVEDLGSTLFVGAGARQNLAVVEGGERALGWPARQIGVVPALKARTGRDVLFAVGEDIEGSAIPATNFVNLAMDRGGTNKAANNLDLTIANGKALPAGTNATWTGTLRIDRAGEYDIGLQILGAGGMLKIDGKPVGSTSPLHLHGDVLQPGQDNILPTSDALDNVRRRVSLTAGNHSIEVAATADPSGAPVQIRLAWVTPEQRAANRTAAIEAARSAKTAIVVAWSRGKPDPFGLPGDQNALIADIAAVNPNTVVILNTGGPVAMPWLPKVKAVMQMWYSGDEGGWALADLLTGKRSPSGRLPFTWPQRLADGVANDPAHPERTKEGVGGKTAYSEGLLMGYRWFDRQGIEPLYPFGYGLSYSKFVYTNLSVRRGQGGGYEVRFQLRNMGSVAADEVAQVYIGPPTTRPDGIEFADRSLAAFGRVTLRPGQTKSVSLRIEPRQVQYWRASSRSWVSAPAGRQLWVGGSSRDLKLSGQLN